MQQRVVTHVLEHFLNNDADLGHLSTAVIYATNTPATSRLRVRPSDAAGRLRQFADGNVTVLLATSVAEEGMDVPAANCVVRFDEVQTPVSLVQSRGRARQAHSSFVLLKVCSLPAWLTPQAMVRADRDGAPAPVSCLIVCGVYSR